MQSIVSVVLICLPLLVLSQKPDFCGSRDCPLYTTESSTTQYEVRRYPSTRWVATDQSIGSGFRRHMRSAFMRLYRYIQGNNDMSTKIDMTVPVLQAKRDGSKTIMFYISDVHVPDTPNPLDSRVRLVNFPAKSFYVRVFKTDSRPPRGRHDQELQALKDALGSPSLYDGSVTYKAGYHAPWHSGLWHNEVWLAKRG